MYKSNTACTKKIMPVRQKRLLRFDAGYACHIVSLDRRPRVARGKQPVKDRLSGGVQEFLADNV